MWSDDQRDFCLPVRGTLFSQSDKQQTNKFIGMTYSKCRWKQSEAHALVWELEGLLQEGGIYSESQRLPGPCLVKNAGRNIPDKGNSKADVGRVWPGKGVER